MRKDEVRQQAHRDTARMHADIVAQGLVIPNLHRLKHIHALGRARPNA